MRVLVTGGLGVNGSAAIRALLDAGHEPVCVDCSCDTTALGDLAGELPIRYLDILDLESLAATMATERIEAVVHMAALIAAAEADPFAGFSVNAHGTTVALEAARRAGVGRFVFTSSKGAYGEIRPPHCRPTFEPLTEDHPRGVLERFPVYSRCKIFSEDVGVHYRQRFGIEFLALRFATIYGPGKQARHGGIGVVSAIVENAIAGRGTDVPAGAEARDDLVYVKDVAAAIVAACTARAPGDWAFNVGSGRLSRLDEFGDAVRAEVAEVAIEYGPGWDYLGLGSTYALMDIGRARAQLGYRPAYDLAAGVRDYAASVAVTGRVG
jgi:UDP-glucose 4-epimerase